MVGLILLVRLLLLFNPQYMSRLLVIDHASMPFTELECKIHFKLLKSSRGNCKGGYWSSELRSPLGVFTEDRRDDAIEALEHNIVEI